MTGRPIWLSTFGQQFLAQRDRWPLWLPVGIGGGVGAYFEMPVEPPSVWTMTAAGMLLLVTVLLRHSTVARLALVPVAAVTLGFAAATLSTLATATPMLTRALGTVDLEGRVMAVDEVQGGFRIVLDRVRFVPPPDGILPTGLRLSARDPAASALIPGQRVATRASIRPVPPPSVPDGFDFARHLYFQQVGAIGTVSGDIRVIGEDVGGWRTRIGRLRADLTQRIRAALPGDTGAVAAALITGDRTAISDGLEQAMRDSGLTHLLSISGLHIAIVSGFVFLVVRGGLALVPWVALRFPIKKWAAAAALVVVFLYAQLAGWTVPTQRSFFMGGLILLAILIDRSAFSPRVVAWAAIVVLLFIPEALPGPSFQMSFASVVALIATWEALAPTITRWRAGAGGGARLALWLGGLLLTSVIATIATAPYAAFHFNRVALFGVVANMIAVPISTLPVMPAGLIAVLLMPFGLEAWALAPMGWAIDVINWVASTVAGWPGAVIAVPSFPVAALAVITLGGCWICLWRGSWRWWGAAPIALAGLAIALDRGPDVIIAGDGQRVAVRNASGRIELWPNGRVDRTAEWWLARWGEAERGEGGGTGRSTSPERCDPLGCVATVNGWRVSYVRDAAGLTDACRRAHVVVAAVPVRRGCHEPALVIDRFRLWRAGSHALSIGRDGRVDWRDVRTARGLRPWAMPPTGSSADQYRRSSPTNRP